MTTILPPELRTKARPPKGGKRTPKKATRNGAVAKAWEIFGKKPKAARKDQLAAAAEAGINPNTVKTQYQRWLHRGDKTVAA